MDELLIRIGKSLTRVGMTALHLQARAKLHEQSDGPALAEAEKPIARSAIDTQTMLMASSRYCQQHLLPRTQNLMLQVESLAEQMASLNRAEAADLPVGLGAIAVLLDRCCTTLRGHARTAPRGAGMMRMCEQRLWGALAAELHRMEGTDGPIMQACTRIEVIGFDLASAILDLPEDESAMDVAAMRDLIAAHICIAAGAGNGRYLPEELPELLSSLPSCQSEIAELTEALNREHRHLQTASSDVALALSIATQASAQSMAITRLEDALWGLDHQLNEVAAQYRAMARQAKRSAARVAIRKRIGTDAAFWRRTAEALSAPSALIQEPPDLSLLQENVHRGRIGLNSPLSA
ncbi:hypothetical protein RGQ15_20405 [Paracoccus sp. MBLB3053]|uniref:Uncharacterized protein n=1 Tax=Paracoccus aurantius TaxID=3073814 RepID=A0ABU2HZ94_9RHOB|nr:hypothetical protein [Paracoccus sp. MBLB3053]MDS9469914.1 hypothetical protein [Paracoccus sp. MBLB3053]